LIEIFAYSKLSLINKRFNRACIIHLVLIVINWLIFWWNENFCQKKSCNLQLVKESDRTHICHWVLNYIQQWQSLKIMIYKRNTIKFKSTIQWSFNVHFKFHQILDSDKKSSECVCIYTCIWQMNYMSNDCGNLDFLTKYTSFMYSLDSICSAACVEKSFKHFPLGFSFILSQVVNECVHKDLFISGYVSLKIIRLYHQTFPSVIMNYHSAGLFDILCLTPLSAIFQLYHGDQF